jgi:hypothetical protein
LFQPDTTHPVGALDLAKNGFYFTGTRDATRCAFCRLEVSGWEAGDTAHGEHLRWNNTCAFLYGRNVGNVPLHEVETGQSLTDAVHAVKPSYPLAKHQNRIEVQSRITTFDTWPANLQQRPELLVDAGFYYTGNVSA